MRVKVAIIGAGPAGLTLGRLLEKAGIDAVIIEQHNPEYVLGRIRAGVLEQSSVDLLRSIGVHQRMDKESLEHNGIELGFDGDKLRIDFGSLLNRRVAVYGQTEITRDLMDARAESGAQTIYNAQSVELVDYDSSRPKVRFTKNGQQFEIECDFIAGCDGFHGVSRKSIPRKSMQEFERVYPFGWLGVLVDQPPVASELIYSNSERGFALCSQRSLTRSRYYIQVNSGENADAWSDAQFWDELRSRLDEETAQRLLTGPSLEKSIAPLRSFVVEPLVFGRLFLAGDAAHIVPPTGAKGLNMALHDVEVMARAFTEFYDEKSRVGIDAYSATVLRNTWRTERFSWWMTKLLHKFPNDDAFARKMQRAEFDYLKDSPSTQIVLAENYTGLRF